MATIDRELRYVPEPFSFDAGTKRLPLPFNRQAVGARVEGMCEMRNFAIVAALAASVAVTGCATQPYGYGTPYGYNNGYNNGYYGQPYGSPYGNSQAGNAVAGAAIGAAGGAIAGAVLPGIKPGTGAIAGAILGGVLGATVNGRQYYRDTRGYCYYVDQYGQPHYSYDIRC